MRRSMTHAPPAGMTSYAANSLLATDKTVGLGLEDLTTLKPTARAPYRLLTGAGDLGKTKTHAATAFGALLGHVTAGRASAFAVHATA